MVGSSIRSWMHLVATLRDFGGSIVSFPLCLPLHFTPRVALTHKPTNTFSPVLEYILAIFARGTHGKKRIAKWNARLVSIRLFARRHLWHSPRHGGARVSCAPGQVNLRSRHDLLVVYANITLDFRLECRTRGMLNMWVGCEPRRRCKFKWFVSIFHCMEKVG